MIAVWPIGLPAAYWVAMYVNLEAVDPDIDGQKRKGRDSVSREDMELACRIRDSNKKCQHLEFLYAPFEPQYWYWEVIECCRRLLLSSANVFISSSGASIGAQILLNLCIALSCVKGYSYFAPYIADSDDTCAEVAQWTIVLSLVSTLMILLGLGQENHYAAASLVFIFLQVICIIVALSLTFMDLRAEKEYITVNAKAEWYKLKSALSFSRSSSRAGTEEASKADPESRVSFRTIEISACRPAGHRPGEDRGPSGMFL